MYKKSLLEECKRQKHLFSIKDGVLYANGRSRKPNSNRMVSAAQKVNGKYIQFSANLIAWLVLHDDIPDGLMARRIDESKGFTKDNMELFEPANIKKVMGYKPMNFDVSLEMAVEIRRKYKNRFVVPTTYNALAKEYGRSKGSIMTIVNGGKSDFWKEVDAIEGPPEVKGHVIVNRADVIPSKVRYRPIKPKPPAPDKSKKKEVNSIFKLFMSEAKKEIKRETKKKEKEDNYLKIVDINPFADEELGGW